MPRITAAEAIRAFGRSGFVKIRQRGSHCILKKAGHPRRLSIPVHPGEDLGIGLLHQLIKGAGLTVDEFLDLLK